jgi:ankyrin repeat domain-containing protein 50
MQRLTHTQALISAHENERFAEVLRTTQAIMFMGTPHRGSDIATSLRPLVDAINLWLKFSGSSVIAGTMRDDLIRTLQRDSDALDEINESFIPRVRDKHIISCFELEWPGKLNQLVS